MLRSGLRFSLFISCAKLIFNLLLQYLSLLNTTDASFKCHLNLLFLLFSQIATSFYIKFQHPKVLPNTVSILASINHIFIPGLWNNHTSRCHHHQAWYHINVKINLYLLFSFLISIWHCHPIHHLKMFFKLLFVHIVTDEDRD